MAQRSGHCVVERRHLTTSPSARTLHTRSRAGQFGDTDRSCARWGDVGRLPRVRGHEGLEIQSIIRAILSHPRRNFPASHTGDGVSAGAAGGAAIRSESEPAAALQGNSTAARPPRAPHAPLSCRQGIKFERKGRELFVDVDVYGEIAFEGRLHTLILGGSRSHVATLAAQVRASASGRHLRHGRSRRRRRRHHQCCRRAQPGRPSRGVKGRMPA